jgi:hypothetical protein
MGVRKTESRIPAGLQAADLGEAVVAADGRCALVSFITAPLAVDRENQYVLFVTDATLAGAAQSFEWKFAENGSAPAPQTTQVGAIAYCPQATGNLQVTVRVRDSGNVEHARIEMTQHVVPPNGRLESLITGARNEPGPGVPHPDVARELVNEHNPYYQEVVLQTPESGDGFKQYVFGIVFDGALRRDASRRKKHLERLAACLNSPGEDFASLSAEGIGVCGIRLPLLAMTFGDPSPILEWTELPEPPAQHAAADDQLRQRLATLDEGKRIDLFNVARFPKSNIAQCSRIIEALRDRYFSGTNFNDVMTGMSGTRAHWITRHFREGPLKRSE